MALLFLNVLQDNRKKGGFLLHEFAVMLDHFHLIITPAKEELDPTPPGLKPVF